jgi:N4-gp56 family major capsid protein
MSKTNFSTSDALTKKAWEEKLFRDSIKESYFDRFSGTGSESIVQEKSQLTKDKGDEITIGLRMKLSGTGVEEGQQLEGNEEKLSTHSMKVLLKMFRHGVRDDGEMSRKRSMFDISAESQSALKDWMTEKVDQLKFDEVGVGKNANTDPSKIFYKTSAGVLATGTAATAKSALTVADSKLSLNMLSFMKTWAMTGGDRSYIPLRPIKIGGKDHFVLLLHPDALYDLRSDAAFQQAQREADIRGSENKLFTGAEIVWDGVIVHAHENCAIGADAGAGSNVHFSKAVFLGAQALCWAWGKRPQVVEEEFDYQNEMGFGISMIAGVKKSKFNSLDYGSLGVYLARTNVSQS